MGLLWPSGLKRDRAMVRKRASTPGAAQDATGRLRQAKGGCAGEDHRAGLLYAVRGALPG
jgi:hypothetical protein